MMKTIKIFGVLTFLLTTIFAFQSSAQIKSEILIVADKTSKCGANKDCLQVKRLDEARFTPMRENIKNFNFVPGYFYVLDVRITGIYPPSGFPRYSYNLRKILARVKSEDAPTQTRPKLFDIEWHLERIDGEKVNVERAFIKFDETKKSAGGNGGCNVFGGTFSKNGDEIKISGVFSTKMYCEKTSEIENKFLRNLERVTRYEIIDGKLRLLSGDAVVLEFGVRFQ